MAASTSDYITSGGNAVGDLFAAYGAYTASRGKAEEAGLDEQSAKLAQENAEEALASGRVQQVQEQRELNMVIGKQQADVAADSFAESGSALDLLRSSTQQGMLTQAITGIQSQIQSTGYQEQSLADQARASSAQAAAKAGGAAAIGDVVKGIATIAAVVAL